MNESDEIVPPMNKGEAAEVVLGEQGFITCKACDGNGWVQKKMALNDHVYFTPKGKAFAKKKCSACDGNGYLVNRKYHAACAILKLNSPLPPVVTSGHERIGVVTEVDTSCVVHPKPTVTVYIERRLGNSSLAPIGDVPGGEYRLYELDDGSS